MDKTNNNPCYLTYDQLPPFSKDTNFLHLMRQIVENLTNTPESEWEIHFNSINDLRKLRKYHRELFYKIMNDLKIKKVLPNYVSSIRSNISKLSLILIKEIFSEFELELGINEKDIKLQLSTLVKNILPEAILKSASDKSFIREEALECLSNAAENMLYEKSILVLLKFCSHACSKTAENAFTTLMRLIGNYEKYSMIYMESWDHVIKGIFELWNKKKDPYIKRPGKLLQAIKEKIGEQVFNQILEEHTTSEEMNIVKEMIKYHLSKSKLKMKETNEKEKSIKEKILEYQDKKISEDCIK